MVKIIPKARIIAGIRRIAGPSSAANFHLIKCPLAKPFKVKYWPLRVIVNAVSLVASESCVFAVGIVMLGVNILGFSVS